MPSYSSPGEKDVRFLMSGFPPGWQPIEVHPLPINSGFSGSRMWQLVCPLGQAALRRWSAGTSERRVQVLHSLLSLAIRSGQDHLPEPIPNAGGATIWEAQGSLWELTTWRPGAPLPPASPNPRLMETAMGALARWHGFFSPERVGPMALDLADPAIAEAFRAARPCPSPALARRAEEWRRLRPLLDPSLASPATDPAGLARRTEAIARGVEQRVVAWLKLARRPIVPRVCLGDVRRAHVLFQSGQVTGIVDFEAVTLDTVARDLGRYLGEVAPFDPDLRRAARQVYFSLLGIGPAEDALADILDLFGCVVASLRWFDWIMRSRRDSPDPRAGYQRWLELVDRLEQILRRGELP